MKISRILAITAAASGNPFASLAQAAGTGSSGTTDAHVAIVGAGPRGTSTLERLCASAKDILAPGSRLTVHVVDPSPPGPGRIWRTNQSQYLLMNSISSQISLYTDDTVTCEGPIRPGPSLHEWAVSIGGMPQLGPDDYPTRAFYGRYAQWVFNETVQNAPEGIEVEVHAARAIRLDDAPGGSQVLTLSNGRVLDGLAAVMLAQGHLPLRKGPKELELTTQAVQHGLRYIEAASPADVELSAIAPGEPVFLRGLGLVFFDYMALLTVGRGGRFDGTSGRLVYHPSGSEPRIFAGSRRGIPYQAKGRNTLGANGRHLSLLLTDDVIAGFRKRAEAGSPPNFRHEVWPLIAKEVETVYYQCLLKRQGREHAGFQERYFAVPHDSPQEEEILDELGVPDEERLSWDRLLRPQGNRTFASADEWRGWLVSYLRRDVEEAELGNAESPTKAAMYILRDLRSKVRLVVDHGGLGGASRRDDLDNWYSPRNSFLSVGPPLQRIEQTAALVEAGVLEILGPEPSVKVDGGAGAAAGGWVVQSSSVPDGKARVTTLVEARVPSPNLTHTADELLSYLLRTGQCRPHTLDGYDTGGLDVTKSPHHVVDAGGHPHPRRFAVGVPTEGVHWVTTVTIRPGVNSTTVRANDAMARAALRVVAKGADGSGAALGLETRSIFDAAAAALRQAGPLERPVASLCRHPQTGV
ncbi:hypothetical protein N8I77_013573 [Diaporthe amygdali]|uniref:FAD-dependent urate hydroxylase HpyO/Asp monooxygenase CreE-like FAD/NAD(P)-binding domain-containing protein n=1 Tax=Phomopsis amygdali TaxID=1214568 RepID=A0AAD9VWG3_PHOAM|nr:hypothetical protein N8I77_013573 [Diaporthe amygdali]